MVLDYILVGCPLRYTCGFFATYTCVLSCFVRFLFPRVWPFSYKRAYICAQKSPYICVTNKHVVYGVTESRRIRGTELYRQQKTPSCTMELESNFSLNQAWPLSSNAWIGLVLIHCPHSSGGCCLPDNGLLESVDCLLRDCVPCVHYFTNADRNNGRFS